MSYVERYVRGTWRASCQRCGFDFKASELRKEPGTDLRVCRDCRDPRHPQERIKARADRQDVAWVSPPLERDVSPGSGNEVSADDL